MPSATWAGNGQPPVWGGGGGTEEGRLMVSRVLTRSERGEKTDEGERE